jgi:excisionase family DNA binding protein/AhpD family alkylhydroperoxidase
MQAHFGAVLNTGKVSTKLKELIIVRTSQVNVTPYCLASHTILARNLGWTDDQLAHLADWPQRQDFTPADVKCSASCGRGNSMASETPLSDVRFLTVAEVALIMRVSKMTVYRLVHSGELEAIRVGRSFRVPESAVNQYLRAAFVGTG